MTIKLEDEFKTYSDMVEFCTKGIYVQNEDIIYCTDDYETYNDLPLSYKEDDYIEIVSYYIIDDEAAEKFKRFTYELVYYSARLNIYLWGSTSPIEMWSDYPTNWRKENEK